MDLYKQCVPSVSWLPRSWNIQSTLKPVRPSLFSLYIPFSFLDCFCDGSFGAAKDNVFQSCRIISVTSGMLLGKMFATDGKWENHVWKFTTDIRNLIRKNKIWLSEKTGFWNWWKRGRAPREGKGFRFLLFEKTTDRKDLIFFFFKKNQIRRSQGTHLFLFQKQPGVELKSNQSEPGIYKQVLLGLITDLPSVSMLFFFLFFPSKMVNNLKDTIRRPELLAQNGLPICYYNRHYDYVKSNLFISQKDFLTFWIWNFNF